MSHQIELGSGPLSGWHLDRAMDSQPEHTLRGMFLSVAWRSTQSSGPGRELLRQELEAHGCTRGQLLRDTLLELEEVGLVNEVQRMVSRVASSNPPEPILSFCQAVYLACMAYHTFAMHPAVPHRGDNVGGKVLETAPTGVRLVYDVDQTNWTAAEWSNYLGVEVSAERNRDIYRKTMDVAEAKRWKDACVEGAQPLDVIAKADGSVASKLNSWRLLLTKVQADALGAKRSDGDPWVWPCTGAKLGALEAQVQRRMDEWRAERLEQHALGLGGVVDIVEHVVREAASGG